SNCPPTTSGRRDPKRGSRPLPRVRRLFAPPRSGPARPGRGAAGLPARPAAHCPPAAAYTTGTSLNHPAGWEIWAISDQDRDSGPLPYLRTCCQVVRYLGSPALSMIQGRQPTQRATISAGFSAIWQRPAAVIIESAGEPLSGAVSLELSGILQK